MQVITVDWASDEQPELGLLSADGETVNVVAQWTGALGGGGWPELRVVAIAEPGVPAWREAQELDAWLETRYGMSDEAERLDFLDAALA